MRLLGIEPRSSSLHNKDFTDSAISTDPYTFLDLNGAAVAKKKKYFKSMIHVHIWIINVHLLYKSINIKSSYFR